MLLLVAVLFLLVLERTSAGEAHGDAKSDLKKPVDKKTQHAVQAKTHHIEAIAVKADTPTSHAAVTSTAAAASSETIDRSGSAPLVVLLTGAAVIAIVALAFRRRNAKKQQRDESDPMRQSLLFHDMDYAAM